MKMVKAMQQIMSCWELDWRQSSKWKLSTMQLYLALDEKASPLLIPILKFFSRLSRAHYWINNCLIFHAKKLQIFQHNKTTLHKNEFLKIARYDSSFCRRASREHPTRDRYFVKLFWSCNILLDKLENKVKFTWKLPVKLTIKLLINLVLQILGRNNIKNLTKMLSKL